MAQIITEPQKAFSELDHFINEKKIKNLFVVCGRSYESLGISSNLQQIFDKNNVSLFYFRDFKPNPEYESVINGMREFNSKNCDGIISVGGGSAIDVAKCIKLFAKSGSNEDYLKQTIVPNSIPFIAVPTTAGTGSESTCFAVIYSKGEKKSIEDESCIPSFVILDPDTLTGLSDYQKRSTLLDSLSHSIESFWSIHSTEKSQQLSEEALRLILDNYETYLDVCDYNSRKNILRASNIAGQAINMTRTTAGHAMCYKLTTLYGISHGHAAAICNTVLFPYMVQNIDKCIDPRGKEYLNNMFNDLAEVLGERNPKSAADRFAKLVDHIIQERPAADSDDIKLLTSSVNVLRLRNNPIELSAAVIEELYRKILKTDI